MPTIEIICLDASTLPQIPQFSHFGWLAETKLQSHRGLFQPIFDTISGVIIHLVNKGYEYPEHDGGLFAGMLIDWNDNHILMPTQKWRTEGNNGANQHFNFRFLPEVVRELKVLMDVALIYSPVGQIYFTTDYQFGPSMAMQRPCVTHSEFFQEHKISGLRFNCLYKISLA